MARIELGMVARDTITGFTGVVVADTQWLHGCRRLTLQPQELKPDGSMRDTCSFDEPQLVLVPNTPVHMSTRDSGGPRPEPVRTEVIR